LIRKSLAEVSRMTTNGVTNNFSSTPPNTVKSDKFALKAEDFIKMMVTQLQNQDPMEPAKNEELLAQMSQIGQLQSATDLQSSLKSMVMQNNIASAGNLIGKKIQGLDADGDPVEGLVNSVRVEKDKGVFLELDNGKTLPIDFVTNIAPVTSGATTAPATPV
jgi:flagellar basal-body rod modification protein FlgD